MYPHWFDMPEGKEGGFAFLGKRKARFWNLRANEEAQRQSIADLSRRDRRAAAAGDGGGKAAGTSRRTAGARNGRAKAERKGPPRRATAADRRRRPRQRARRRCLGSAAPAANISAWHSMKDP
jgi:hypothetical protein